jgi:phosphoribosylformylglycinamidine synthase
MEPNDAGRFHSGFTTIRIEKTPSIMLKDMENSVLGVWSSHGEGKFAYRDSDTLAKLKANSLICFRYTDGHGCPTQLYPANPNGSEDAVAGLTSPDGRHLCSFF